MPGRNTDMDSSWSSVRGLILVGYVEESLQKQFLLTSIECLLCARLCASCQGYRDLCPWSAQSWVSSNYFSFFQRHNRSSVKGLNSLPAPTSAKPQTLITRQGLNTTPALLSTWCPQNIWRKGWSSWTEQTVAVLVPYISRGFFRGSYSKANRCDLSTESCPSGCSLQVRQRLYIYGAFKA